MRRYLLHLLPKGVARIRHYGFLANRNRENNMAKIRLALEVTAAQAVEETSNREEACYPCPVCKAGCLRLVDLRPAGRPRQERIQRR